MKASKRLFDEMVDARHSTVAAIMHLLNVPITVFGLERRLGQLVRVQADYRESAECRSTRATPTSSPCRGWATVGHSTKA